MSDYGGALPPPPPPPSGGFQQPGYGAAPSGAPLASWIQRVGAYLVDFAITLPFVIVQNAVGPKVETLTVNGVTTSELQGGNLGAVFLLGLIILAINAYNRWYLGGQGQSLGKRAIGLTLVAESTGAPIGMGKAFLRDVVHFVDAIICFVGFLFPLWDAKRQTISDKVMTTLVIAKA